MAERLLVDGYNVLHHSSKLQRLIRQDMETAREALIDKVAHYCIQTGHQVTIVFDGQGAQVVQRVEHYRSVPTLEVLYAPGHLSADAVIERMVYQTPRKMDVAVVTSDRGVRDLCRGMGALVMDANNFLKSIQDSRVDAGETVRNTQKPAPANVEDRLNASSLALLEELRKKL